MTNNCDGCQAGMRVISGIHVNACKNCHGAGQLLIGPSWSPKVEICGTCSGKGHVLHMGCTRMNYTTGEPM